MRALIPHSANSGQLADVPLLLFRDRVTRCGESSGAALGGLGAVLLLIQEFAPPRVYWFSRGINFYLGAATVTFDDKPHPFITVVPTIPGEGFSHRYGQFRQGPGLFKLLLKIVIEAHNYPFCRNS